MKTKKIPLFYIFLLVFAVIVVILTQIGKSVLKDVLAEYEDTQYKYVAEDFFNDNFVNGSSEALAEIFAPQIADIETEENISEYLSSIIQDKNFSMQHSSSGMSDLEKYTVSIDNLKFAEFYISKTGSQTKHGFDTYEVSEVLLNKNILKSYSIEIPVGYILHINGEPVKNEYAVGDEIETESYDFMPEGVKGITYTTYTVDNMCAAPEFLVKAPDGTATEVFLSEDGKYRADIVNDTALAEKFTDYVIEATKAYACYMQKDANFGKVKGYLDPASEFYKYVKETPTWPVITHNGYSFENAKVTEFYAYNDEVFSCRISLIHVLKYSGLEDYRDSIDITWYLRKVNGKYLIYDSFTH